MNKTTLEEIEIANQIVLGIAKKLQVTEVNRTMLNELIKQSRIVKNKIAKVLTEVTK